MSALEKLQYLEKSPATLSGGREGELGIRRRERVGYRQQQGISFGEKLFGARRERDFDLD